VVRDTTITYLLLITENPTFPLTPTFVVIPNSINFNATDFGCTQTASFVVKSGILYSFLQIAKAWSTNPNYSVSPTAAAIAPGDSQFFTINFHPVDTGSVATNIIFTDNSQSGRDSTACNGIGGLHPGEIVIRPQLGTGWRLVSIPVQPTTCLPILRSLFSYRGNYVYAESMKIGIGYWQKGNETLVFGGSAIYRDSFNVSQGWNLIGSLSSPVIVSTITSQPPSIKSSYLYGYADRYFRADTIQPGHAYWVKVRQDGILMLNSSGGGNIAKASLNDELNSLNRITIYDDQKHSQALYFGAISNHERFELPPVPPPSAFDVRFSSQRFVDDLSSEKTAVDIRAKYPITAHWNIHDGNFYSLAGVTISGKGSYTFNEEKPLLLKRLTGGIPLTFGLLQNYPNPFNPLTVIRYQLPVSSRVTLKIYNILGQEVKTLVDQIQDAGYQSVEWNGINNIGTQLTSGVYFYRLSAVSARNSNNIFTIVKKMMFIK
jgi:hypothetical protein